MVLNTFGILLGAFTFLAIGISHPLVIKAEYHIGKKSWWMFCAGGLVCSILSLLMENSLVSAVLGAFAFSFFWGILEVFKQEQRVLKGWFPENPRRAAYYAALRARRAGQAGGK